MAKTIKGVLAALLCAACASSAAQGSAGAPPASQGPVPATDEPAGQAQTQSLAQARALVQRADEIRFPKETFQVDVRVTTQQNGQAQEPHRYRLFSKGSANTIIQTLEPAAERGQNLLMKDRDLWVFMPHVSQPVRLSLSQRLTGQVANGDLARLSFAEDYSPKLIGSEKIAGRDHHVLELNAAGRNVTYQRVVLWVRQGDNHPHKAEFYALSGRLLKTCLFTHYQMLGGRLRPTRLVMTDALKSGEESTLDYSMLVARELPDRMFTKEFLKKLD